MTKLTFQGIRKIFQGDDHDLKGELTVQFISFSETDGGKVYGKGNLSCGNYSMIGVLTQKAADETGSKGYAHKVCNYDVLKFTNYKVNSSKDKKLLIINGAYQIVKTGLKVKIGEPLSFYDCEKSGNFGNPTEKNTLIPNETNYEEHKGNRYSDPGSVVKASKIIGDDGLDNYFPIDALNTMSQDWIVLAKWTNKSTVREYNNKNGPGKLFNLEFSDLTGNQIEATGFNEAVDKWYDVIEKGKVYIVSNWDVKLANKRFSRVKNDYWLFLRSDSVINQAEDQNVGISDVQFTITPIAKIYKSMATMTFDIGGVIIADQGTREITTKNGPRKIRSFTMVDSSALEDMEPDKVIGIDVNVWGENPDQLAYIKENQFVVVKRVRTSEYKGGLSINTSETDEVYVFDQCKSRKEWVVLFKWFKDKQKAGFDFRENLHSISSGDDSNVAKLPQKLIWQAIADNTEYFITRGHVEQIRTDDKSVYPACPECKRKIQEEMGGGWNWEKWDKNHEKPVYSYMLNFKFADGISGPGLEGNMWANCFRECGDVLLGGMTAEKYNELAKADGLDLQANSSHFDDLKDIGKKNSYKRYTMYIRKSENEYMGEISSRYTANKIYPIDYPKDNIFLLDLLTQYQKMPDKELESGMEKLRL